MKTNQLHPTLSLVVAATIKAEPSRCWRNAALTILTFSEFFALGTYVEGWIVVPRAQRIDVIEHGWCTSPEMGIVDPTLVLMEHPDQPVYYVPGFELAGNLVRDSISGKTITLVCNSQYGRDGMGHAGYRQSYDKAWQYAHDLACERHLPQTAIRVSTRETRRGVTIVMQR